MTSSSHPQLRARLNRILETRTDSPELLMALTHLGTFYQANTVENRLDLLDNIEEQGVQIHRDFLSALSKVQHALAEVKEDVDVMSDACEQISARLETSQAVSKELTRTSSVLQNDMQRATVNLSLSQAFLRKYTLTQEQLDALQPPASVRTAGSSRSSAKAAKTIQLDRAFFDAWDRVRLITSQCHELLLNSPNQRVGMEILETMSGHQEAAYQRLYRWVQQEVRKLDATSLDSVDELLPLALSRLSEKALYSVCLREIATQRRNALTKMFVDALQVGGPNGVPRPIEIHSHDPIRYVSDMCAWIHQTLASERELMRQLFQVQLADVQGTDKQSGDNDGEQGDEPEHESAEEVEQRQKAAQQDITQVLSQAFDGVCRPFQIRVEQVVLSLNQLNVTYRIKNILQFYQELVDDMLYAECALSTTFTSCTGRAEREFNDMVRKLGDKLVRMPPSAPSDLMPPIQVHNTLAVINELMESHQATLTSGGAQDQEFAPVLKAMVQPLLKSCTLSTAGLDPLECVVYMLNCIQTILQTLEAYAFTKSECELLRVQLEVNLNTVVREQVSTVLTDCNVADKVNTCLRRRSGEGTDEGEVPPLSEVPGMDQAHMKSSLDSLRTEVIDQGVLELGECDMLMDSAMRARVRQLVLQEIARAYDVLYAAILAPNSGYTDTSSLLVYTPEQVREVLGVEE